MMKILSLFLAMKKMKRYLSQKQLYVGMFAHAILLRVYNHNWFVDLTNIQQIFFFTQNNFTLFRRYAVQASMMKVKMMMMKVKMLKKKKMMMI